MFKPGDKVKCINNGQISGSRSQEDILVEGQEYVVLDVVDEGDARAGARIRLSLEGVGRFRFRCERFVLVNRIQRNLPSWF